MPDGAAVRHRLRPQKREARLTGSTAVRALVSRINALIGEHGDVTVVLSCSTGCREMCATGALQVCHGHQALAERYAQLRAARDAAAAAEVAEVAEVAEARQWARQAPAAAPAARRAQQRAERPGANEAGAGTIGYMYHCSGSAMAAHVRHPTR